jgi:hypothetical protein
MTDVNVPVIHNTGIATPNAPIAIKIVSFITISSFFLLNPFL